MLMKCLATLLNFTFLMVTIGFAPSVMAGHVTLEGFTDSRIFSAEEIEVSPDMRILEIIETQVVAFTNQERETWNRTRPPGEKELPMLKLDVNLRRIARTHGVDMIQRSYFNHLSPEGITPHERIAHFHRSLISVSTGEIIWKESGLPPESYDDLAELIVKTWMESPSHRDRILQRDYTHFGAGIVSLGNVIMATENFAGVIGYISPPLPKKAVPNQYLVMSVTDVVPSTGIPAKFDLVPIGQDDSDCDPIPLARARLKYTPGVYRIRIHFLDKGMSRWLIYFGPTIQIL